MIPDNCLYEANGKFQRKQETDGSSVACLGLHEYLCKEIPCITRLTLIKRIYKERILQNTCINKDLPYKERPSPPRNECQLHTTIKPQDPHKLRYA